MSDRKYVSSWLPEPIYEEFSTLARRNERSIGAELRIAVANHLNNSREQKPFRPDTEAGK